MNLRLTGGTAQKSRASGFLLQRHAHHAASRLTWVIRWLKRACRHHAQSRELKNPMGILQLEQDAVEEAFELAGALSDLVVARARGVLTPKQLVGDVQRCQHGK